MLTWRGLPTGSWLHYKVDGRRGRKLPQGAPAAKLSEGPAGPAPFPPRQSGDNGVTQEELVETITHLAFYAGWPSAMTAVTVAKEVFENK